jgi:hypothetical protein
VIIGSSWGGSCAVVGPKIVTITRVGVARATMNEWSVRGQTAVVTIGPSELPTTEKSTI